MSVSYVFEQGQDVERVCEYVACVVRVLAGPGCRASV